MAFRLLVLAALIAVPGAAGWDRFVDSFKGDTPLDSPPAHPLAYFQTDPCLRPAADRVSLLFECTWPGKPPATAEEKAQWARTVASVNEIGRAERFTIFEVTYSRNGGGYPDPDAKSVVVKTAANTYREIDIRLRRGSEFPASSLLTIQGRPFVDVPSHDGGQNVIYYHRLYLIAPDGGGMVDLTPIEQAARAAIPPHMSMRTYRDDFASLTREVEAYRNDLNLPWAEVRERARITITFRIDGARAVVTGSRVEPYHKDQ